MAVIGRNDPCPCGSGRQWEAEERALRARRPTEDQARSTPWVVGR